MTRFLAALAATVVLANAVSSPAQSNPCNATSIVHPVFTYGLGIEGALIEPNSTATIEVLVLVDENGVPTKAVVLGGPGRFAPAEREVKRLEKTALAWRFAGQPSAESRQVSLVFRFRTLHPTAPQEELEPVIDGCTVEVRAYALRSRFARLDEIPTAYLHLYDKDNDYSSKDVRERLPCDSITLRRPRYEVQFRRTGDASYSDRRLVARGIRHADFHGEISLRDFSLLCYALDRVKLNQWAANYSPVIPNHKPWVLLIVVESESRRELTVYEHDGMGPPELWLLQQAIDGIAAKIEWHQVTEILGQR